VRSRPGAVTLIAVIFIVGAPTLHAATTVRSADGGCDPASILRGLHADYADYIRAVRVPSVLRASASPEALYSGLVRAGGSDPRLREDAPASGHGARNDVVLFAAALDAARAPGWLPLILDHEYFHARHLAGGWSTPLVEFGDAAADHDYYEAVAWGYVCRRARDGVYGDLASADLREVRALYARHFEAIRAFILERQPTAWAHYVRFMPDMDGKDAGRQAPAERDEVVLLPSRTAPGGVQASDGGPR
jgi:hypothetical protein